MDQSQRREYWSRNLRLISVLLAIWFTVSFVFGILLVEPLNEIVILNFPLGFWFAQQGSIYTFVVLIGVYVWRMDRLDDEYGVSDREGAPGATRTAAPQATPRTDGPADGQAGGTGRRVH